MRTPIPLVILALAAPALAGCLNPSVTQLGIDAPAAATAPGASALLPWGLEDCTMIVTFIPVPSGKVLPHVPEGFELVSTADLGFPDDPRGDATFSIEYFECAAATGPNGSVSDTTYGSYFTTVRPPKDLENDSVTFAYFVKWDVLVTEPSLREALLAAGIPAKEGAAAVDVVAPVTAGPATASLDLDGARSTLTGLLTPGAIPIEGSFLEFTQTPDGLATWYTEFDAATASLGTAVVTIPSGTLASEIVGDGPVQAYVLATSGVSFRNGVVTLPTPAHMGS